MGVIGLVSMGEGRNVLKMLILLIFFPLSHELVARKVANIVLLLRQFTVNEVSKLKT